MPEVMSAVLKASGNSSSSPEGGRWLWKADGLTSFHTGITSQVTLQLSVLPSIWERQHQCQTHIIPNRRCSAFFRQASAYSKFCTAMFSYSSKVCMGQEGFSVRIKQGSTRGFLIAIWTLFLILRKYTNLASDISLRKHKLSKLKSTGCLVSH